MKNKEVEGLVNFFRFLPEAIEQNTKEHPEDLHLFRDSCVLMTAPGLSKSQLRMGLGDTLAMVGYFLEQYSDRVNVKGIDSFLAFKGAPKLTSLLMSSKKRVRTIIKTGKIKNDEDYYLLKEVLSDVEEGPRVRSQQSTKLCKQLRPDHFTRRPHYQTQKLSMTENNFLFLIQQKKQFLKK